MKTLLLAATALAIALAGAATVAQAAEGPPPWAYGYLTPPPPGAKPDAPAAPAPQDDVTLLSVPGSKLQFTRRQLANRFGPADWFPEDHPPMPDIVAHGKEKAQPQVFACSLCHLTNGRGRPENANITGLSYEYFVQQLIDFRSGARKTSDPRKGNTSRMADFTKSLTDDDIKQAALFFTAIPAVPWVKVIESDTAPKVKSVAGLFIPLEGAEAGTEPIGNRIVEVPVNSHDAEYLRNSRSGFIAYVPPGSVKKGEALVANGTTASGGKVTACTACHGPSLGGLGPVPRLAGRSPSYIARQLYDMQLGNRKGAWTPLMAPVVVGLDQQDLLNASAYLASVQ
jgi:cytochrome c553